MQQRGNHASKEPKKTFFLKQSSSWKGLSISYGLQVFVFFFCLSLISCGVCVFNERCFPFLCSVLAANWHATNNVNPAPNFSPELLCCVEMKSKRKCRNQMVIPFGYNIGFSTLYTVSICLNSKGKSTFKSLSLRNKLCHPAVVYF